MGGARLRGAHTERRCAGVVDGAGLAGGEMSEDPLDDLGSVDARDDAQRGATHTTVFDVDVEDALEGVASSSWVDGQVGAHPLPGVVDPVRGTPSAHARAVSNRASNRLQARSACASLYTDESGGHQPCRVPA